MTVKGIRGLLEKLAVLACLTTAASALPQKYHEDNRFGFKIKPPGKWEPIPAKADEQWLAAMYVSDSRNFYTDPDTKYTYEHRSEMRVIAFVDAPEPAEAEEEDENAEEEEEDEGSRSIEVSWGTYDDYEDYLDSTYSGGGFYVDEREEDDLRGIPYTRLGIRVEKLARSGPKHIETWIFHLDGVDLAVQFEVLLEAWSKEKKTVERALKSFREADRTEPMLSQQSEFRFTFTMLDEGTLEEREEIRRKAELQEREKASSNLGEDWFAEPMGRCFMVSHVDEKYTKDVAEQATTLLDWLDENFEYVGPGEYVREPVIKICKDQDEESAFWRGARFVSTEIVTHKTPGSLNNFEWEYVNMEVYDVWMRERNRDLYYALPAWLSNGLRSYVRNSVSKRGKVQFHVPGPERDKVRNFAREGHVTPPREVMRMGREQFGESGDAYGRYCEAVFIVRYLFTKEAQRDKLTKNLLEDYLTNLAAVVAEIEAEEVAKAEEEEEPEEPQTEEEEEERYKQRANRWKERERRIIDEVHQRTFGHWSADDWADFEKGYFDFIE